MPRRTGSTISFNQPRPINHSDDMLLQFLFSDYPTDGQCWAPLGPGFPIAATPPSVANNTVALMNRAGTLSRLLVRGDAEAATATETFTVWKNGVATSIVANTAISSTDAQDNTHSVSVASGDEISIGYTVTGSPNFTSFTGALYFTPA